MIDDPILTAKLYEIAMQKFSNEHNLDTTLYHISLFGDQDSYKLFFSDKATYGKVFGGNGYVVIFRRSDLTPLQFMPTQ